MMWKDLPYEKFSAVSIKKISNDFQPVAQNKVQNGSKVWETDYNSPIKWDSVCRKEPIILLTQKVMELHLKCINNGNESLIW